MNEERVQVSRGTYTTAPPEEPGTMIPNFELDQLEKRAQAMTKRLRGTAGWAFALLGGAIGVGASALTMYAYEQDINSSIAAVMWSLTVFFFVLAGILGLVHKIMMSDRQNAVDEFCDELRLTRRRYGEPIPPTSS